MHTEIIIITSSLCTSKPYCLEKVFTCGKMFPPKALFFITTQENEKALSSAVKQPCKSQKILSVK